MTTMKIPAELTGRTPCVGVARGRGLAVVALAAGLCATALLSTGCNTVEGAGKDVAAAGEGISNAASGASDTLSGKK